MSVQKRIAVVGSVNVDLVVAAERFAAPGETITGRDFKTFSGGKGANQAAAAARLGARTQLFARIGDDGFAPGLLKDLRKAGVDIACVESTPGSTGAALITTVDDGQNSIVVVPGANGTVEPADIDQWWPAIGEADIVLAQLEIPIDAVMRLAVRCQAAGIPFMLDPAPAQTLPQELLCAVTWLTPNESETRALTGMDITQAGEAELHAAAETLLARGVGGVVLKLGTRGAYMLHKGVAQWIKPFMVEVVDTTAAGDAFNGAFAASLLALGDPFAAGRVAAAAAALSTTRAGAIPSMPGHAQVEALLKTGSV